MIGSYDKYFRVRGGGGPLILGARDVRVLEFSRIGFSGAPNLQMVATLSAEATGTYIGFLGALFF